MKQLLAIAALLAVSTAHAETYICLLDSTHALYRSSKIKGWESTKSVDSIKTIFVLSTKNNEREYSIKHLDGTYERSCNVYNDLSNTEVLCLLETGQFRFNKDTGQYFEIHIGYSSVDFVKPNPRIEVGTCELYK